jgi:uncharacterized membrane protein
VLFAALAAGAATLAAGFLQTGAWPVALFLALELALFGGILCHVGRHAGDRETILLDDERLWVVVSRAGRETRHEFQRYWLRVRLESCGGGRPSRLSLRSHGRELELGAGLREPERRALARDLSRLTGPGGRERLDQSEYLLLRGA